MPVSNPESIAKRLWWLTLLRGVISIALGLVALQEYPFSGHMRVSPVPLERTLALITPPGG